MKDLMCHAEFGLYPKRDEEPLKTFKLWSNIIRLCFRKVALIEMRE